MCNWQQFQPKWQVRSRPSGHYALVRFLSALAAELPHRVDAKIDWRSTSRLAFKVIDDDPGKVRLWIVAIMAFALPVPSIHWIIVLDDPGDRVKYAFVLVLSSLMAVATLLLLVQRIGERHRLELDEQSRTPEQQSLCTIGHLEAGDPQLLGAQTAALARGLPHVDVCGGCCGDLGRPPGRDRAAAAPARERRRELTAATMGPIAELASRRDRLGIHRVRLGRRGFRRGPPSRS